MSILLSTPHSLSHTLPKTHKMTYSKRVDGKFLGPGGMIPASQAICSSLLEDCFEIAQEIRAQEESKNVPSSLKPIHDRLSTLRAELEGLALTHRWSLRETDLWNYSLSLQEIDKMRIDGKFVDLEGNQPGGQYVSDFCPFLKGHLRGYGADAFRSIRYCCIFFDGVMVLFIDCYRRASQYLRNLCQ